MPNDSSSLLEVVGGRLAHLEWQSAKRRPSGPLSQGAVELAGYFERSKAPLERFEGPVGNVVVVFNLGPRLEIDVSSRASASVTRPRSGFVSGLGDYGARVRHPGEQRGLQINLHPPYARELFGVPLHEVADRVFELEELLPSRLRSLPGQLTSMPSWSERFEALELAFNRQVAAASRETPRKVMDWALAAIRRSHGRVSVADLADRTGYSEKHFRRLFLEHVGVSPRRFARIVRFEGLAEWVRTEPHRSFSDLAVLTGFFDLAHLHREVRSITGMTPTAWRHSLVPDGPMSDSYEAIEKGAR
ncbi:MAG: helix-turn-helix domain-containing protein [Myxococcota bacterium]